jgi:hypothetical protein
MTTPGNYTPSDQEPLPSGLLAAERMAVTVARRQLARDETPPPAIAASLMHAVDRLSERCRQIAGLISPCPEPGITDGRDLCPCGSGQVWPCDQTRAAWLAAGLDPDEEVRKVIAAADAAVRAEQAEWEALAEANPEAARRAAQKALGW